VLASSVRGFQGLTRTGEDQARVRVRRPGLLRHTEEAVLVAGLDLEETAHVVVQPGDLPSGMTASNAYGTMRLSCGLTYPTLISCRYRSGRAEDGDRILTGLQEKRAVAVVGRVDGSEK
jgi:hypothetical protein